MALFTITAITTTASPVMLCLTTGMPAVTCCSYAHPANWMWRILSKTGIAPPCVRGAQDDDLMPALAGEALAVDPWTCLALSSRVTLHLSAKPLFLKLLGGQSLGQALCSAARGCRHATRRDVGVKVSAAACSDNNCVACPPCCE